MKSWLEIQRTTGIDRRNVRPVSHTTGRADGACPGCGAEPFLVRGSNPRRMSDDRTMQSNGRCVLCSDPVGYIYARPDTLFGLEEDELVLVHGRARVYWS